MQCSTKVRCLGWACTDVCGLKLLARRRRRMENGPIMLIVHLEGSGDGCHYHCCSLRTDVMANCNGATLL